MSCDKNFLGFHWERHAWDRRVVNTVTRALPVTDQWGRSNAVDHVVCHAQYVCRDCGAIRDEGECGCEKSKADVCAVRLEYLAEVRSSKRDLESGPV